MTTFHTVLTFAFVVVALSALGAPFVKTPYGRFANDRAGIALDPRLGWFLMELPSSVVFVAVFVQSPNRLQPFPLFVLFVWCCHYAYRGFLMPLAMRVPQRQKTTFSLAVVLIGWLVTSLHGYLNATWVTAMHPVRDASWFSDPRFLVGVCIYYAGFFANLHSDHVLRTLRSRDEVRRGEHVYRIPMGGLYRYVTNASYLTELVLWAGFATFTWSPAGLFIFAISAANLVPRAISTHRWYRGRFPEYPRDRKILVPFVF